MALLTNPLACSLALLAGLAMLLAARPEPRMVFSRFLAVNSFILFMWILVPFTTPGQTVFRLGWLAASREGVLLCSLITLKANALLAVFIALIAPMQITTLGRALAGLHCPARLAWLLLLMERNVHILKREWGNIGDAARLRAFAPKANLATYRAMAAMLAMLFLHSHNRGQRLYEAMLLSGFDGNLPAPAPLSRLLPDFVYGLFILLLAAGLCLA